MGVVGDAGDHVAGLQGGLGDELAAEVTLALEIADHVGPALGGIAGHVAVHVAGDRGVAAREVAVIVGVDVPDAQNVVLLAGERALLGVLGVHGGVVPLGEHRETVPLGGVHAVYVRGGWLQALEILDGLGIHLAHRVVGLVFLAALAELVEVVDRAAVDFLRRCLHLVGVVEEGAGFGDFVVDALDLGAQHAAIPRGAGVGEIAEGAEIHLVLVLLHQADGLPDRLCAGRVDVFAAVALQIAARSGPFVTADLDVDVECRRLVDLQRTRLVGLVA